jgi:DNA modification methylase
LKQLDDESVQCVITSPPYWGLRDYGTATWEGGDPNCDHQIPEGEHDPKNPQASSHVVRFNRDTCYKCGARRIDSQIGLEPTPEAYVADLVEVFREVKRVLRDDGVLWLNLGDSYAGSGRGRDADGTWNPGKGGSKQETNVGAITGRVVNPKSFSRALIEEGAIGNAWVKPPVGYKCKDLCMIPAQVAIALRADGWYLRSDIIWNKPNPMPESVTDRCTKSHEDIFMLTKSERYYYDAEAIKEPSTESTLERGKYGWHGKVQIDDDGKERRAQPDPTEQMGERWSPESRNKRDVWTVATQPCAEAHFATFSPKLIEPMILAGTSEKGCCPKCGKPWERIVEHENAISTMCPKTQAAHEARGGMGEPSGTVGKSGSGRIEGYTKTLGWQPTCDCGLDPIPCTILDPFMGSGTTAIQAVRLHRHYLGCELNPEYVKMAERRIADMVGPLFVVTPEVKHGNSYLYN